MSIETFETLDRLYKSIENLAYIFYKKDNYVAKTAEYKLLLHLCQDINEDVNKSIKKVIDTYTELKNIREE